MEKRELLWDWNLAERSVGVSLRMHHPIRKSTVLTCDAPWEGEHCGYGQILWDGEKYRLYYRGCGGNDGVWKLDHGSHSVWCVAFSKDGRHFEKPDLGIHEYGGSTHNNIIMQIDRESGIDNFSIMLDTKPDCAPEAKYKAVSSWKVGKEYCLAVYHSADGLHFERVGEILTGKGAFDSMNIVFWNARIGKYCLYLRSYHELDRDWQIEYEQEDGVRDIRVSYSEDFVNWTRPCRLDYGEDKTEFQLYTNGIMRYDRADIYVGIPARYIDRTPDGANYRELPDLHGLRAYITQKEGRSGTAITDAILITSRDGVHFRRSREAFFTPGPECGENWVYGDCYFAHGLIETESDFYGEPKEMSLYVGKGYRSRPVSFERYTLRLDGFFSWRADFEGGEVITKPMTADGARLSVNFSTSALGYLRIELLDEDGTPLDGYDSGRLFGDSVDRAVAFSKPLEDLRGKAIRLKISMRDCDFYSFCLTE